MSSDESVSLSPRRKKIKNNEIYSSLSSSEDLLPPRLLTPVAGSKRKHISSNEDDEFVQSSKVLKVVPFRASVSDEEVFEERQEEHCPAHRLRRVRENVREAREGRSG